MANFCGKCGRPLKDGEVCNCGNDQANSNSFYQPSAPVAQNSWNDAGLESKTPITRSSMVNGGSFIENMKNRMGIGDPELNKGDAFEKGQQIVPDVVSANEGEIPVRQYTIAKLRNRILGITYSSAIGRLQVTNKRVLFRAPGRSIGGRTVLQQEFLIDEVAGVETRREYVFNFIDFLFAILISAIGAGLGTSVSFLFVNLVSSEAGAIIATLFIWLLGAAALVPFFLIKKKWYLKMICTAFAVTVCLPIADAIGYTSSFLSIATLIIAFLFFIVYIINAVIAAIKPNLVLIIKTKGASDAVDIKRKRNSIFFLNSSEKEDHTGYAEILPINNVEGAVREIGAVVNDIQKLGDYGIEKWKSNVD